MDRERGERKKQEKICGNNLFLVVIVGTRYGEECVENAGMCGERYGGKDVWRMGKEEWRKQSH